jgi:REP element-mobilizing transposase RayT
MRRDYIEWQDRSSPLAFLITIRCYGTWLHGDDRGSMDRTENNIFRAPKISPRIAFEESDRRLLKHAPIKLDAARRAAVEAAIREFAEYRQTTLYSLNVRTNHAHLVLGASDTPEKLMTSLKAYSTRRLRELNLVRPEDRVWSRHGSTRWLWTEDHISQACEYVALGQGGDLPMFD